MSKFSPGVLGVGFCAMAALFYSASSICMRQVSALNCDPSWAICIKELVTVLVVAPIVIYRIMRGLPLVPSMKILGILIAAGLVDQLLGNLCWQSSVKVIGLVVTVPTTFGVMIASSAVFGRFLLGEKVTSRSMGAIAVLMVSLVLLSLGAESTSSLETLEASVTSENSLFNLSPNTLLIAQAVILAGMAGTAYALLSIAIRHTMTADTQQSTLMFVVTLMGVITLGPLSFKTQGFCGICDTTGTQYAWMVLAGFFNLLGFIGITRGLKLTTVVHANVLNASQVAMASVAGMLFFREPPTFWIILGICTTVLGIILVDRPIADEAVDQAI